MKRSHTPFALVGLLSLWAAAPRARAQALPTAGMTQADAPRITAEEVRALVKKGDVVIVDVRTKEGFASGHAEGAISVPLGDLASRLKDLPKTKAIVSYCTCGAEASAARATVQLLQSGYPRAFALKDGLAAWQKAGGVVTTPQPLKP